MMNEHMWDDLNIFEVLNIFLSDISPYVLLIDLVSSVCDFNVE